MSSTDHVRGALSLSFFTLLKKHQAADSHFLFSQCEQARNTSPSIAINRPTMEGRNSKYRSFLWETEDCVCVRAPTRKRAVVSRRRFMFILTAHVSAQPLVAIINSHTKTDKIQVFRGSKRFYLGDIEDINVKRSNPLKMLKYIMTTWLLQALTLYVPNIPKTDPVRLRSLVHDTK